MPISKHTATNSLDIIDNALDILSHEQARLLILAAARAVLAEMGHEPTARQLDGCLAEFADQHVLDLREIVNLF